MEYEASRLLAWVVGDHSAATFKPFGSRSASGALLFLSDRRIPNCPGTIFRVTDQYKENAIATLNFDPVSMPF
jgi:hypothetical protein